jgi:hypothetical protein
MQPLFDPFYKKSDENSFYIRTCLSYVAEYSVRWENIPLVTLSLESKML